MSLFSSRTRLTGGLGSAALLALGITTYVATADGQEAAPPTAPFSDYRVERAGVTHRITVADLPKPFATEVLVARVRALLRRGPVRRQPVLDVGDLRIESARRRVRKDGVIVPLTAKEFTLLAFLADRAGEVVDRFDVLEHCWDQAYEPESNVVDVHVGALRRKLGSGVIETVRGAGYRLVDGT